MQTRLDAQTASATLADRPSPRGWCPSVSAPMDATDGALMRFQPPSGRLTGAQVADLAAVSRRHADGSVLITRRAKLELRGVADTAALQRELRHAGLFVPRHRRVPDCLGSPADDRDPDAVADAGPVVRSIIDAFESGDSAPDTALPDKFLVVVNGNGRANTAGVDADVRFDAQPADTGYHWRVGLGGDAAGSLCLGHANSGDLPALACALAGVFNQLRSARETTIRRVRHALEPRGRGAFLAAAAPWLRPVSPGPAVNAPATTAGLGDHGGAWYGFRFAFGRIPAEALEALAGIDDPVSGAAVDVRLMPDRRLLVVTAAPEQLPLAALRAAGAIDNPTDPRLRVAACIGQRGCRQATTDTRADARLLANTALPPDDTSGDITAHVSGCAKGCAHPRAAPVTLVGRDGAYDLVVAAGPDAPPLMRGLGRHAAGQALAAIERLVARERRPGETPVALLARLSPRTLHDFLKLETADV